MEHDLTRSDVNLFRLAFAVEAELRRRGIVRDANPLIKDFSEYLVARALGVGRESNRCNRGWDVVDRFGYKVQVKSLRQNDRKRSKLGLIPVNPEFDYLVVVEFNADCSRWWGWEANRETIERFVSSRVNRVLDLTDSLRDSLMPFFLSPILEEDELYLRRSATGVVSFVLDEGDPPPALSRSANR